MHKEQGPNLGSHKIGKAVEVFGEGPGCPGHDSKEDGPSLNLVWFAETPLAKG